MKYKTFNKKAISLILLTFVSIMLFNLIIDPYYVFNSPKFEKINSIKNNTISHNMSKFYAAKRSNATVLLIGTSRTAHIHPKYLKKYFLDEKIYNLAIPGSGVISQKNNIEYFVKHKKVKAIIYGVDFFAFNPVNNAVSEKENSRYTDNNLYDYMNSLLSIRTLRKSIKTLQDNIKKRYEHLDYEIGWETYEDDYLNIKKDGNSYIEKKTSKELKTLATQDKHFNYEPFKEPSSIYEALKELDYIVKLCKDNQVELYIFISPIYSKIVDIIYNRGYQKSYNYWKKELSKYENIYDFSGYNSITTNISNYIDGSHYQTEVAKYLFAKMFNDDLVSTPSDFGIVLNKKNIDEILLNEQHIARHTQ